MVALIEKEEAQPRLSEKQKDLYHRVRDYAYSDDTDKMIIRFIKTGASTNQCPWVDCDEHQMHSEKHYNSTHRGEMDVACRRISAKEPGEPAELHRLPDRESSEYGKAEDHPGVKQALHGCRARNVCRVRSSSSAIRRLYAATSAERIVASLRSRPPAAASLSAIACPLSVRSSATTGFAGYMCAVKPARRPELAAEVKYLNI
jgi:hypothetical protein